MTPFFRRSTPAPRAVAWLAGGLVLAGLLSGAAAFGGAPPKTPPAPTSEQAAFFEKNVRPVLAVNCYGCHSESASLGGVRLDSLANALKGNAHGPAVVPGDPDKSTLVQVIQYVGKIKMPPGGKLKPVEIAALAAWVKMGAPWPQPVAAGKAPDAAKSRWWSFQPVRRPLLPTVKNMAWAKSPLDRFVLAKLEAAGLSPARPADKRTLIRRAYFDLIGLPPTPAQVAAFVSDKRPDAFARVVDELLASPHYGERWGRHWLDVARYADSNGLDENKAFAHAWRYRDYVIGALNADKPYDQFVREQIAGDLLPINEEAARNEAVTATGFLTLGAKVLAEQDKPKLVMDIVDEQIEVSSKAFLGLTVSCARCHDHKFDPISTKDYYALAGIFKSTKTMKDLGFVSNWNERTLSSKTLDAERAAFEKTVLQPLRAKVQAATETANSHLLASVKADAPKYLAAGAELARQPGALLSLAEASVQPDNGVRLFIEAEKFDRGNALRNFESYGKDIGVIHTGDAVPTFAEWDVTLPAAGSYQVELRYAAQEARPVRLLLNGQTVRENAAKNATGSWNPDGQRWEVQGIYAAFTAGKNTLRIERDGPIPHVDKILVAAVPAPPPGEVVKTTPRTAEEIARQHDLIPELVERWATRLRGQTVVPGSPDAAALLADTALLALPDKPAAFYPEADQATLKTAANALKAAEATMPATPVVMAVEDGKGENVRVHVRGSTQNLGDEVPRHFPVVLAGEKQTSLPLDHSGRLELARWLTRPENPLTARVEVNRVWLHHFGVGLVGTPDNFGLRGEKPSHPELLDYLADTFTHEDGWSLKRLHRRILLSAAYQMSSTATDPATLQKAARVDPENRLLWRASRRRLEAEPFRDALLAVSGKLDTSLGGSLLSTPDNDYVTNDQSADAARYNSARRSVYLPIIRNALFDEFQAFDVGDPSTVNARRATTTVAPQALWVLNSPFAREQSEAFAAAVLFPDKDDAACLNVAYRKALGRAPTAAESARASQFLTRYAQALTPTEPDRNKRRRRAWQSLCQVLFASNEFIYVD